MYIDQLREYCLSLPMTSEGFPFDENTLVFKVCEKMFCLTNVDEYESINLKCEPLKAIELREMYEGVTAGFHMNKKHWNTVSVASDVDADTIQQWVFDSYMLVVKGLKKADREMVLEALEESGK